MGFHVFSYSPTWESAPAERSGDRVPRFVELFSYFLFLLTSRLNIILRQYSAASEGIGQTHEVSASPFRVFRLGQNA